MQKERLEDTDSKKRRLVGGGRKAKYPDIEALASYIEGLRSRNLRVTTKAIQRKALELSHSSTPAELGSSSNKPFAASRGWLCNFMKRWGFSLRRRTTVGQRLPPQLTDKVVSFIMKARKLRFKYNYELLAIGNMDETPCWMDMAGNTTVTQTGAQSVPIFTTGHDKARFTVCLTGMANGNKLKPFIVFKGVRRDPQLLRFPGVVVEYSKNGWMNEKLTEIWVDKVWGTLSFHRRMLVWDAYKCHLTDSVEAKVKQARSDVVVVPGGLTKHLQPADVSWNKPFKEAYRSKYEEWLLSGEMSFTPAGNMRAPSKLLCVQWVKEVWDSLSEDLIKNSFLACGISIPIGGSQDSQIHCMQDDGVASAARAQVEDCTRQLLEPNTETEDPFDEIDILVEDEEELENNEAVIDGGDTDCETDSELSDED